jgi:archaellum biogenesis ATPase FlaH
MVITEQNALRDRYHASVMVKIRKLYKQTRDEIDLWCRSVLVPLELELNERESQLKRRLLNLERVRNEDSVMMDEIRVLQSRLQGHHQRIKTIDHFMNRLDELSKEEKPILGNVIDLRNHSAAG